MSLPEQIFYWMMMALLALWGVIGGLVVLYSLGVALLALFASIAEAALWLGRGPAAIRRKVGTRKP